jgi:hypothetical protein
MMSYVSSHVAPSRRDAKIVLGPGIGLSPARLLAEVDAQRGFCQLSCLHTDHTAVEPGHPASRMLSTIAVRRMRSVNPRATVVIAHAPKRGREMIGGVELSHAARSVRAPACW